MINSEDIKKLNTLIVEADDIYGRMTETQEAAVKRASYKLGLLEAYNDDHEEQLDNMDMQLWLNGDYATEERKAGYERYCAIILNGAEPKYKAERESTLGPDFREAKWKALVAKRKADEEAKEAAKAERRRKREERKKAKTE